MQDEGVGFLSLGLVQLNQLISLELHLDSNLIEY